MVERIRRILQANQLTPTQFADSIGVARPIISHILSGRNKPSLEVVQKILTAFPQLSLDWLLKGAGSMLAGAPITAAPAAAQSVKIAAAPIEEPISSPSVQKATKVPRYRPQPAPTAQVSQSYQGGESALEAPLAHSPYYAASVVPIAVPAAMPPVVLANQSATVAATVVAGVAPVLSVPAVPAAPVEAVAIKAAVAAPAQAADVSLATAFAEPGKVIRRIVIFYQDGTFTDYQPEPHPA